VVTVKKIFFLFFLFATVGSAQQVRLTAKTDSDTYPFGSWIDVNVDGKLDAAVESIAPVAVDSIGLFEVIFMKRASTEFQWLIRLTSIDTGKIFLPPIAFGYKVHGDTVTHKAFTNSLLFTINGMAVNPQGEIKDIKPPLNAPWHFEDYLPYFIAVFVLLMLGIGYEYYRSAKKKKKDMLADVKVVIPPHREALTALRVLEEKKLWQQGKVKEYYSEATEIIRRFFEKRWNIIALEMTTDEILGQLKHVPEAVPVWKETDSFFLTADLVKFAKYQPSPSEHEQEISSAYTIVRAMTPKVVVPAESQQQEVTADVR
jgi:hypothetical protein